MLHGFNTLRFEADMFAGGLPSGPGVSPVDPDGPGPGAPIEPAPEPGPDLAAQMAELQETISQQQQMFQQLAPMAEYLQQAPQPQLDGQTYNSPQPPDPFSENYAA